MQILKIFSNFWPPLLLTITLIWMFIVPACGGGGGGGSSEGSSIATSSTEEESNSSEASSPSTAPLPASVIGSGIASAISTLDFSDIPANAPSASSSISDPNPNAVREKWHHRNETDYEAPDLTKISFSTPDENGYIILTGTSGSVQGSRDFAIINLSSNLAYTAQSNSDGSFSTSVFAPYGSILWIKHDNIRLSSEFDTMDLSENNDRISSTVGTFLKVLPASVPSNTFYSVMRANGRAASLVGVLTSTNWTSGNSWSAEIEVQYYDSSLTADLFENLTDFGSLHINPLYGSNGKIYDVADDFNASALSISGFPITGLDGSPQGISFGASSTQAQYSVNSAGVKAQVMITSPTSHTLPDGVYYPRLWVWPNIDNGNLFYGGTQASSFTILYTQFEFPLVTIGSVSNREEPLALFMATSANGERGILDYEKFGETFLISNRRVMSSRRLVLPPQDETGNALTYNLMPFVPRWFYGDRSRPRVRKFPFMEITGGQISGTLTLPNQQIISLPQTNFSHFETKSLVGKGGEILGDAGGVVTDSLQIVLDSEEYKQQFTQNGIYRLNLTGQLTDRLGQSYAIDQNFSWVVGKTLTLIPSVLPTTPFHAGESFSPSLTIVPPVPATVSITVEHFPNSDVSKKVSQTYTGTANSFGFFAPSNSENFVFNEAGEYRISINAVYQISDGTVWHGSKHFSSVVASTSPEITLHGRRGADTYEVTNRWYNHNNTGNALGSGHFQAPYEHGDILWVENGHAAVSRLSLAYHSSLAQVASGSCQSYFTSDTVEGALLTSWQSTNEMPLFQCLSTDVPLQLHSQNPTSGLRMHAYHGVERFWVRVREEVTNSIFHSQLVSYWRFNEQYDGQIGMGRVGDNPDELKFHFGGVVVNDFTNKVNHYASYGSSFVLLEDNDSVGSRVFPPFEGGGLQPGGGAILTLNGQAINAITWPTELIPGNFITHNTSLPFRAHLMPTLDLKFDIQITNPGNTTHSLSARANRIGFVSTDTIDFESPGVYQFDPQITLDRSTSAGSVSASITEAHALASTNSKFYVYVIPSTTEALPLAITYANESTAHAIPGEGHYYLDDALKFSILTGQIDAMTDLTWSVTVFSDGWILDQKLENPTDVSAIQYSLDIPTLDDTFRILDTNASIYGSHGDLIRISFYLEGTLNGEKKYYGRVVTFNGENYTVFP